MPYIKRCEMKNTYKERQFEWKITNFFCVGIEEQIEHEGPSFSIGDISCSAELNRYRDNNGYWSLNIRIYDYCEECDLSKLECIIGFKKVDGTSDRFHLKRYDDDDDECFYYSFSESELMERKHEFTTSDCLTITCTMKHGTSYYPQPTPDQPTPMKLARLDILSENFKSMFANKSSCDVSLQVKDKVFDAHKAILMARSPVFSAKLKHNLTSKQTCLINIPDNELESFQKFLMYLYCGKLEDISFQEILHFYSISDKFKLKELRCFCVQYMEQCLSIDNVCDIIMLAEKNEEVKLLSLARRYFCKNSSKIINTSKWKSLSESNSELVNKLMIETTSKVEV